MGVSGHSGQLLDRRWWGDEWGPAAECKYTADGLNPGRESRSMIGKRDKIGFTVLWNFSLSPAGWRLAVCVRWAGDWAANLGRHHTAPLTILSCPHSQHSPRSFLLSSVCVLQTAIFIRASNESSLSFRIKEKDFSLLKVPTTAFTFKTLKDTLC